MRKIQQDKIPVIIDEDNVLKIAVEQGVIENEFNWKLVRERDGLTNQSKEIMWLEWNDEGRFKAKHDKPAVGRSLLCLHLTSSLLGKQLLLQKSWKSERIILNLIHAIQYMNYGN
jgi:YD repeat-containing protein